MKTEKELSWKKEDFLDCLEGEASENKLKIPQSEFLDNGEYPIIDQGENFIAGYTNDNSKVYSGKLPVVVFGDHTRILKFVDFPFAIGADGVKILVPKDNIHCKYFYYALRKADIPSAGYSRHYKFLKDLSILLPPIETQNKIVAILEKAEALKQKREMADKFTHEYQKSMFYEMFGDPLHNKKKWRVSTVEEICNKVTDGEHSTPNLVDEGIPYISAKDINNSINLEVNSFVTEETYSSITRRCLPEFNDILITCVGTIGRVKRIDVKDKFVFARSVALLKLNKTKVNPRFVESMLSLPNMTSYMIGGTNTATVRGLYLKQIKALKIPLPPIELQNKFAAIIEHVEKMKEKQLKNKDYIGEMFNSLMQKAFNGGLVS
jgi:type I restriction enzyme S subunit